ncbi:hypothetical protein AN960_09900 [Bacillus sp. FJAT-25509]|uniref:DUF4352 domain-containing protein n=1 Tax=Bacillus sp. FJAT-25509 TaxID=1712029 RepID=UPI0006FAE636|nr:DUF4352 domain-containing protein [Bacillus sp. FJAT-25509]KQL39268.1 hypothetical protein AN960_09900 [Bacillus sp. FJAT-25509]
MLKIFYWFLGVLIIAGSILSGCNTQKVNTEPGYDVFTQKTSKPIKDKIYKMGETVEFDKIQVTIEKAYFTKPSIKKNNYKGDVLTVELQVWSKPYSKNVHIEPTDFDLYDSKGEKKQHYTGYIRQEINGNLSGEKSPDNDVRGVEGALYFETSKSGKYELVYKPSFSKKVKEIKFYLSPN